MMNDNNSVDIAKYSGVLAINASVNFGINTHGWVRWSRVVPHVSHTFIQVLAESRSRDLQAIESMNKDGFIVIIRN